MEDTNSYNKFSERFTRRKSEELAAMIGDHNFEEEARIAAALELEKRGEGTPEEILEKAKLTNGLRATEQRANDKYRTFSARFVAAIIDSLVLIPISVVPDIQYGHLRIPIHPFGWSVGLRLLHTHAWVSWTNARQNGYGN